MERLSILTSIYLVVLVGLLLAPFDYHFPLLGSSIKRLSETNGIQILSTAGIQSPSPAQKLYNAITSAEGFTVEVWSATEDFMQEGPARIVSYSIDHYLRNFTLGQEQKALVIRLRTTNTDLNGKNPQTEIQDVFLSDEPMQIVVTYDYSKESVYINGKKRVKIPGPGGNLSNWDPSYPLLLGNEATGDRPWRGSLFLVAIYNRALIDREIEQNYWAGSMIDFSSEEIPNRARNGLVLLYLFNEMEGKAILDRSGFQPALDLKILTGPQITRQAFLERPYHNFDLSFTQVAGMIGNILIFVPLGFLLHATIGHRYGSSMKIAVYVIMIGAIVTFCIESIQYFSLTRFSSMTDVVNNMIGVSVGILIDKAYVSFFKTQPGLARSTKASQENSRRFFLEI